MNRCCLGLPDDLSPEDWIKIGSTLGSIEGSVRWWRADWWAFTDFRYADRRSIVEAEGWDGPSYSTLANDATVARVFQPSRRRELLSFSHHAEVVALAPADADALLDLCAEAITQRGKALSTRELRAEIARGEDAKKRVDGQEARVMPKRPETETIAVGALPKLAEPVGFEAPAGLKLAEAERETLPPDFFGKLKEAWENAEVVTPSPDTLRMQRNTEASDAVSEVQEGTDDDAAIELIETAIARAEEMAISDKLRENLQIFRASMEGTIANPR